MALFDSPCRVENTHEPRPERFVTHHILPLVCGGKTTSSNEIRCCDNCHAAIHSLLYALKLAGGDYEKAWKGKGGHNQRYYALLGYNRAVIAETVDKIPDEGGSV